MTENEFILADRIAKIKSTVNKYGEENFAMSFSGGKDSTVMHYLFDMALPNNKIPRVYVNTGIELNMIRDFVLEMQKTDDRIIMIKPTTPIKPMLERDGYPFKSKMHSEFVKRYQSKGFEGYKSVRAYVGLEKTLNGRDVYRPCPKKLKHQFTSEYTLKISVLCCVRMKEEPLDKWRLENNKPYQIIGIMKAEGGRRIRSTCLAFSGKKLKAFQPLVPITKAWEDWFIQEYNIKVCDIYNPPYNFFRTGCKGCPFAINLQQELDTLEKYFPAERKQCEYIWKPVYDEYRRIGYRLKPLETVHQMTIDEWYETL